MGTICERYLSFHLNDQVIVGIRPDARIGAIEILDVSELLPDIKQRGIFFKEFGCGLKRIKNWDNAGRPSGLQVCPSVIPKERTRLRNLRYTARTRSLTCVRDDRM